MNDPLGHMHPAVRPLLDQPMDTRIRFIRSDRWIDYPLASFALQNLDDLLDYPKKLRMPCLLIYGQAGVGKTAIIAKFLKAHAAEFEEKDGIVRQPVLAIEMPPNPEQKRFYHLVLHTLGIPARVSPVAVLEAKCLHFLAKAGVRMLVIDEVHHMLTGSANQQRITLNLIKHLSNVLRIPVVCAGTDDAAIAIQTDLQLASRFQAVNLVPWQNDAAFAKFLRTVEQLTPLRLPTRLAEPQIAHALHSQSRGVTGEVLRIVTEAAVAAIRDGTERITEDKVRAASLPLPVSGAVVAFGAKGRA